MALFLAGIVFGLIAAMTIGWALFTGWLIIAYVLVTCPVVVGFSSVPYLGRLEAALPESDDAPPGPELEALQAAVSVHGPLEHRGTHVW